MGGKWKTIIYIKEQKIPQYLKEIIFNYLHITSNDLHISNMDTYKKNMKKITEIPREIEWNILDIKLKSER